MLAPVNWLKDYISFTQTPEELAWELTEVGLGLETIHKIEDEPVLELEITPNRPDCLAIVGITREIAALTNHPLKIPPPKPLAAKGDPLIEFHFDAHSCQKYSALSVKNVSVKESPAWLKKRLIQVGLRPINNLVDISNYVMYELGNPIHIFDQDKISGGVMRMEKAQGGESFVTVDGQTYSLPPQAVIIKDREKIIDLCGIKGGLNTSVTQETKNIFIHVPVYEPVLIRRTSKTLGLASDASYIYERGADPLGTMKALQRTVELILKLGGGEAAGGIIDEQGRDFKPHPVKLNLEKLDRILGVKINRKRILTILANLDLSPKIDGNALTCLIPTFRSDLNIAEDLIEEVARHYGYNRLPRNLPVGEYRLKSVPYRWDDKLEKEIKLLLMAAGFSEVATYSLLNREEAAAFSQNPEGALRLLNPVSRQFAYLQPTLIPSLLSAVKLNLAWAKKIALFELGRVFPGPSASDPRERVELAAVKLGPQLSSMKGTVELIAERLGLKAAFKPMGEGGAAWLHPFRSAAVVFERKPAGLIGEIHPQIISEWGLGSQRLTFFSLKYEAIEKLSAHHHRRLFQPPSRFPAVIEDLTAVFPTQTLIGDVLQTIKTISSLISEVIIADEYEKAFTFRITFQSRNRNLSAKDVAAVREKIIILLKKQFGARLKETKAL